MEFYKELLGKNSRNQTLLTQVKIDIKHLKYLKNDIDVLFDVDENLLALGKTVENTNDDSTTSENYLRIA